MAIATLAISAVLFVIGGNQSAISDSEINGEALGKAQGLLENAQATARLDFSSLAIGTQTSPQDGIYQKSVTVTSIDADTKLVTSLVKWALGGRLLSISLPTIVTNPVSGPVCSQAVLPGWDRPQAFTFDTASDLMNQPPPDYNTSANGLGIADLAVYRQKLYIVASDTAGSDHATFFVFSLPSDPGQTPGYLGRTVTVGAASNVGLSAVTVAPSGSDVYAYVANAYSPTNYNTTCRTAGNPDPAKCAQLQIIKVTDPTNPQVVKNVLIPATTASGALAAGNSIYYSKGYVYLGLKDTSSGSGSEFNVIDVGGGTGSPTSPNPIASFAVGSTTNSIFVKDNYAYVSTDDNHTNGQQLLILDVSKKDLHIVTKANKFSGGGFGRGEATDVVNGKAYFGKSYSSGSAQFNILDVSNPSASPLPVLGSKVIAAVPGAAESVYGVANKSNLAFLLIHNASDPSQSRFQIFDVSSAGMPSYGTLFFQPIIGMNFSAAKVANCSGNYFYVGLNTLGASKDTLAIIVPGGIDPSAVTLSVHDAAHNTTATAYAGDTVHPNASVSGTVGTPGGTATFQYWTNGSCTGGPSSTSGATALSGGAADATAFAKGPLNASPSYPSPSYSFKVHYSGNFQYNPFDSSCVSLAVAKADQTIAFAALPDKNYGDPNFGVSASASSGLTVTLTSQTVGVCTLSGSTVHIVTTGTCTIRASQAGNSNYNPAPNVDQSFTVQKAPSITTVTCPASVTYNGSAQSPCTASVTGAGGLSLTPTPTYANNTNAGTATASYNYAGDANHTGSSDLKNFTINKATPVVTWSNPASITYGTSLGATQLNSSANVPGTLTYTPASGTLLNAGPNQTLSVHFVPADSANYNIPADKTVSITVNKATPTITTTIFNAATNVVITHAPSGTVVYDKASLSSSFGTPIGTVTFTVSTNKINCGNPTQAGGTGTIASGSAKSSNYATSGNTSYQAVYNGDSNFNSVTAACEALPAP